MSATTAALRPTRNPNGVWGKRILTTFMGLILIYTMIPIAVMIVFSFNFAPNGHVAMKWLHFTWANYINAFGIQDLTGALINSLYVAVGSALIAVILATPLALALVRYKFWGKTTTDVVIFAGISAPSVVVGASLLAMFLALNFPRGLLTIFIAHIAFDIAFAVVVIRARVSGLDRTLDRAAADLGATPWIAFWVVTFPLILPGIIGAWVMAFMLSINDLIITLFVAGQTLTFPLWVYGATKIGTPPQVYVLSTLIFLGGILLVGINSTVAHLRKDA